MLVYLFDVHSLDDTLCTNNVDRAIRITETDRAVALPLSFERVVSEVTHGSGGFQPFKTHQVGPQCELPNDVRRSSRELLPRGSREFELNWDSVPLIRVQSSCRTEKIGNPVD